jgi:citrate synthase
MSDVEIKRGLKDVYFATSEASFIDGNIGKLLYRGYNIDDMAQNATFEETVYLLLHGKLPTAKELADFDATLRANRSLPKEVMQVIELVKTAHPMDVLRTAISALAAFDPDTNDNSPEATLRKGVRLTAQAPTIVTAHDRLRQGKTPLDPDPKLNHAANFLYMLFGKEPDPEEAKLLDLDFVLHAEHGSNASAFAARVTASTLADLHCAVTSGVGTLKGPWHGGAAEAVMKMALDIGSPERASDWARGHLETGGRIMGFGHRVYRAEDPRARHMRERSRWLAERKGEPRWFQILTELEHAMQPYAAKGICVNVDFYAGSVYYLLGVAEDLFIPIFAMGRIPGWTLQVLEQFADNILIRPLTEYVGPMDVKYVPLSERR